MAPGSPSKKAGHPHPELNLVADLYRGVSHPAHLYTPSSKNLSYSPVNFNLIRFEAVREPIEMELEKEEGEILDYSVPFSRRIRNCSGLRIARHSSSVFWTEPGAAIVVVSVSGLSFDSNEMISPAVRSFAVDRFLATLEITVDLPWRLQSSGDPNGDFGFGRGHVIVSICFPNLAVLPRLNNVAWQIIYWHWQE
ncbi:hypothetical protein LINPERHAP1_LOCUS10448 [Linum perenne]